MFDNDEEKHSYVWLWIIALLFAGWLGTVMEAMSAAGGGR